MATMHHIARKLGATSQLVDIFIEDSSVTTGAGKTGLLFNSASLTAYYHKSDGATAVVHTLQTMTAGTWASGGFIEIDATNMPGMYQLGIFDAALSSGRVTSILLKGAANMKPTTVIIDLFANADVNNWTGQVVPATNQTGVPKVDITHSLGTAWAGTAGYARLDATGSLAFTESYAADGAAPTLAQAIYLIQQALTERVGDAAAGTITVKKLDGAATAAVLTCTKVNGKVVSHTRSS